MTRKRVAVIGSGCAGIGAVWALKDTGHDVHLYEADECLGGHTNTVTYSHGGRDVDVDTGFIVFNNATYPNFINFLRCLGVDAVPTDMTFGVSRDGGAFEWAGTSLGAVFAQASSVFSPRVYRMIFDIVRFNQFALDLLQEEDESEGDPSGGGSNGHKHAERAAAGASRRRPHARESIGAYLDRHGYSDAFRDDYLMPMTAAVWSTGAEKCSMDFPALTLVRFMWNHHLLSTVGARPSWMTIPGGARQYIDAVMRDFPQDRVHLRCPVASVEDINGRLIVQFENDDEEIFDHVVLACHGGQALEIVRDGGTQEERDILSAFETSENVAYLHSDLALMPRRRRAWSAWNLLTKTSDPSRPEPSSVCLTYNMNILQHIPVAQYGDVLVTLNPDPLPAASTIQGKWVYNHPLYNARMIAAQKELPRIQNTRGISYVGAWTKYGFHEDGFSSGIRVAVEHLGAELPFEFVDSTFSRGKKPSLGVGDWIARLLISVIQLLIVLVEFGIGVLIWPVSVGSRARRKNMRNDWTKVE